MPHVEFECIQCGIKIVKYRPPSAKGGPIPSFCSRSCQMKHTQSKKYPNSCKIDTITNCLHCSKEFAYREKPSRQIRKFCSKECSSRYKMLHGSSGWCTTEKKRSHLTEKFGAEEAEKKLEQTKKLRSDAVTKKNIGRVLTEETREKISSKLRDGYAEGRISTRPPHHLQRRLFEILLGS